jgi:hypothetical protein
MSVLVSNYQSTRLVLSEREHVMAIAQDSYQKVEEPDVGAEIESIGTGAD